MERTKYLLDHEWHVAVNRHSDEWRKANKEWGEMRFMYEAKSMAGGFLRSERNDEC